MSPEIVPPRVVLEDVRPCLDGGHTPIRRVPGDVVAVEADLIADGVLALRAVVRWQEKGGPAWRFAPMEPIGNDRWRGSFVVPAPGVYRYGIDAWVDPFRTWRAGLERYVASGRVTRLDLDEGLAILRSVGRRAAGAEAAELARVAERIERTARRSVEEAARLALAPTLDSLAGIPPPPESIASAGEPLEVVVDPPRAGSSAWYEVFPRSTSPDPHRPGTLRDVAAWLPYIADLGFTVVYLPPIHPIGRTHRRGPNNTANAPPDAPGSPWAIGAGEGGHTAIDPGLGTLAEFRQLLDAARDRGLEVAMDLAFQCSPDHPWVREHPAWFAHRADGSLRTAENPPKRYDDIVPFDFDTTEAPALWSALRGVVDFWVAQGVRWFRVDNPHTKPFAFWRWLIEGVRAQTPEVLFLAEAFTRPKVMYRLAKVGFTHSYTYFTWRTTRAEIAEYFGEIGAPPVAEFFRPHLWVNTPDILAAGFHDGKRAVFLHRLVLAATLSSHYGMYGPAYERLEHTPVAPGSEEYLDSEKYAVRHWPRDAPGSIAPEVRRLNAIRRAHPALTRGRRLVFHPTDNDRLLAYHRATDDGSDTVLVVVNLDPDWTQSGWTSLDLAALGLRDDEPFRVHDLWTDARYDWRGRRNFVRLDPAPFPAHLFALERHAEPPTSAGAGR